MNPAVGAAVQKYKNQLSNRFYSNSMSMYILVCLIVIFILVIEIIKLIKKTYEWQLQYEMQIGQKYVEESRTILKERSQMQTLQGEKQIARQSKKQVQQPGNRSQRTKKESYIPPLIKIEQVIKTKIPQIIIIAINVVMLSSYEFCAIISYILIVLIVISELISTSHLKLKVGLQVIWKILLITLYINLLTVQKPSA